MSTPSIKVGQGNWGIKAGNLLGYANTEKKFSPVEFTSSRALDTATRVNASGNIAIVNANIPRIDYFGGQASLLVEPSGTNSIRNNSMVNAVTGTPGTLPTYWSNQLGGGITRTIVGTGTENGVSYIDIRFSGTQNDSTPTDIRFESATQIVASNGQTWSESVWLKIVAAPNPPIDYRLYMFERTSVGGFIKSATQVASPTTTLTRYSFTRALDGGATVAGVQPALTFTTASDSTYDFTIRIGYPQMEQSSVATSVIPTTTGSVTRNADVISVTGVAGLIGQTEGTIYAEVDIRNLTEGRIFTLFNSATRYIVLSKATSRLAGSVIDTTSSPTTVVSLQTASGSLTAGTYKLALAYASGDFAFYVNGTQVATSSTGGVIGGYTSVRLGHFDTTSFLFFNDRIRAAEVYTTRLPNTTTDGSPSLQSITTL